MRGRFNRGFESLSLRKKPVETLRATSLRSFKPGQKRDKVIFFGFCIRIFQSVGKTFVHTRKETFTTPLVKSTVQIMNLLKTISLKMVPTGMTMAMSVWQSIMKPISNAVPTCKTSCQQGSKTVWKGGDIGENQTHNFLSLKILCLFQTFKPKFLQNFGNSQYEPCIFRTQKCTKNGSANKSPSLPEPTL